MSELGNGGVPRPFIFKVNGVEIEVAESKLMARDILELAKERGAMPGKPEDYILQGDKRQYKPDDWVDLEEDNSFITIPTAPTPVATFK